MDKHKIIDEVLAEWAMRSPDGLVGGHDTPENIAVLNEILDERRINNPQDYVFDDPENPGKKIVIGHPLYDDGVPYEDVLNDKIKPYAPGEKERYQVSKWVQSEEDKSREDLQQKYFRPIRNYWVTNDLHPTYEAGVKYNDVKYNRAQNRKKSPEGDLYKQSSIRGKVPILGLGWTIDALKNKGFNENAAMAIRDSIYKLYIPSEQRDFLENAFNKLTPDQAIEYINTHTTPAHMNFYKALDAARRTAKGSGAGSTTGPGEILLVLLIKDGKTRGSKSGDIEYEGQAIEVKEITNGTFDVSETAFAGGFENLEYISLVTELIGFCKKKFSAGGSAYPTIGDALITVCETAPVWKEFPQFKEPTLKFFEKPSMDTLLPQNIYGIELFAFYIRNMDKKDEEDAGNQIEKGIAPNTVEFDLQDRTTVMQVKDMPDETKAVVQNPSQDGTPKQVSMTVAPISGEEDIRSKLVIPALKRLGLFLSRGSKDKLYTPDRVAKQMFKAMQEGSYTGGIIFKDKKGGFFYEKDLLHLNYGDWYFSGYGRTGPQFTQDTPEEFKK